MSSPATAESPDRDAERERVIALEASRRIPADLKAKHTEIPWADIAGVGNILRHGYDSLDHAVIWSVVENDLPPLKAAVEAMLKEIDGRSWFGAADLDPRVARRDRPAVAPWDWPWRPTSKFPRRRSSSASA